MSFVSCGGGGGKKKADLRISFTPNPVSRSRDGKWHYTIVIEETQGVGFRVSRFKVDSYNPTGTYHGSDFLSVADFIDWFDDCSVGSAYIPPEGTVCGIVWSDVTSGHEIWTFTGRDDNGAELEFSGRLDLR